MNKTALLFCLFFFMEHKLGIIRAQQAAEPSLVEKLFEERDPVRFQALMQKAKEQKIPSQALFEVEFLYAIDSSDDKKIAELTSKNEYTLATLSQNFQAKQSQIFATKDDLLGALHFSLAVKAFTENNRESFREHATQSFWFSPTQAPLLEHYIESLKIETLKEQYIHPKDATFQLQDGKGKIQWNTIVEAQQGCILFFYSPWDVASTEASLELEELKKIADLKKKALVCYLVDSDPNVVEENRNFKKELIKQAHQWAEDSDDSNLLETFRVKKLPFVVDLSVEGKLLQAQAFNQYLQTVSTP
jgi:hypothetical protein